MYRVIPDTLHNLKHLLCNIINTVFQIVHRHRNQWEIKNSFFVGTVLKPNKFTICGSAYIRAIGLICYLVVCDVWCWERVETIGWTDHVRNGVLKRVKEERNILQTIKRRMANWIGHILRRNCLLKHVIEGKIEGRIEVMGR
jgi:hypothetical protein